MYKRITAITLVFFVGGLLLAGCSSTSKDTDGVSTQGVGSILGAIQFSLGSLIAEGAVVLGNIDGLVTLSASGTPAVTCTSPGGNQAPGQNPPKVSGTGSQIVIHDSPITKNGRSPFLVEANAQTSLSARQLGCPNNNWKASIDFVYWDRAVVSLRNSSTGALLDQQSFSCITTRNPASVSCTKL